jgi:2-iminobutanoate/2-iminopropanoate deaminase
VHTPINPKGVLDPSFHYSLAVKAGSTIYVSGLASLDADKNLVGRGDVVAQTRRILENLEIILAAGGATLDDVVKVTVFLADREDRRRVNDVRREYFGANKPASTLVEVSRFPIDDMLVEIEAIAVLPAPA